MTLLVTLIDFIALGLLYIVLLDIFEVSVSVHFEFAYSKFVSNDDSVRMSLEGRKCASL